MNIFLLKSQKTIPKGVQLKDVSDESHSTLSEII